jgi:signal transduction histidine kinase/CheY-like chemotaxis protein
MFDIVLRFGRVFLPVLLCLLGPGRGWAAVVDVPAGVERLPLGPAMEYFVDDTGRLDWVAASRDSRYLPAARDSLTFGYGAPVLWVRLSLRNPGATPFEYLLQIEPERLERVSLFRPDPDGGYRRIDNGLQVGIERRPLPDRNLVFPLRLEPARTMVLYLRVETRNALSLMPVLWAPKAFEAAMRREDRIVLLGIGMLLGLSGYTVLLFPLQRDRSALYLGISMFLLSLFEASYGGYGYAYLWPDHPNWALQAMMVFALLMQGMFNRFIKAFVGAEGTGQRWVGRWMDVLLTALLGLAASHVFGVSFAALMPFDVFTIIVSMVSHMGLILTALFRGYRPVRFVVLGQAMVLIGTVLRIGEGLGWLPFTLQSGNMFSAGVAYAAELCFFAAISRRVDLLQQEKDTAQARTLEVERNTSARLEAEVAERTRELSLAKERAERADRAKGEFLARVSHELRTPLHTILGYAALLRRDFGGGKAGERLVSLEDGGRHLLGLIEDLLNYARCEQDSLVLAPEPVFLYRLLARLDDHGAALAARQTNRYSGRRGDGLPAAIRVDGRRLEQVVLVLLSNAARYTRHGTIVLEVVPEPAPPGRAGLRFVVADTGIGIAAADLARIFEPFERAVGAAGGDGLGLGLAIARQIVRAMGGDIDVESRPDAGSRFGFSLELPVAQEDEVPAELAKPGAVGYAGPTRRVLLMEDTAAHRRLLEHLLSDLGFEVRGAASLTEARGLIAAQAFDLALLDQWLPDGTAYDLLPELAGAPGARLPAILISAMPPAPPPGLDPSLRFEAILLKPLAGDELLEAMGRVLDLDWIGAESGMVDRDDTAPVSASGPAADSRAELRDLAEAGAVYEIEEWVARARLAAPRCEGWLKQVETRLAVLDFEGIAALADDPGFSERWSLEGCPRPGMVQRSEVS